MLILSFCGRSQQVTARGRNQHDHCLPEVATSMITVCTLSFEGAMKPLMELALCCAFYEVLKPAFITLRKRITDLVIGHPRWMRGESTGNCLGDSIIHPSVCKRTVVDLCQVGYHFEDITCSWRVSNGLNLCAQP